MGTMHAWLDCNTLDIIFILIFIHMSAYVSTCMHSGSKKGTIACIVFAIFINMNAYMEKESLHTYTQVRRMGTIVCVIFS
jgi:hypothetical protein